MLAFRILFCSVLFATAALAYVSHDLVETTRTSMLDEIKYSISTTADTLLKASEISDQVSMKINNELAIYTPKLKTANEMISHEMSIPNEPNMTVNISQCVESYQQLTPSPQPVVRNITECVIVKMAADYTRDMYDEIEREIKHCEPSSDLQSRQLTLNCYKSTKQGKATPYKIRVELEGKINHRDGSYVQKILEECKNTNKLPELIEKLSKIDHETKKCIKKAKKPKTVMGKVKNFFG